MNTSAQLYAMPSVRTLAIVVVLVAMVVLDRYVGLVWLRGILERGIWQTTTVVTSVEASLGRPVELVKYWRGGLERIADLERRLSDVTVDYERLVELERQVAVLSELQQVEVGTVTQGALLVPVIQTDDGVLIRVPAGESVVVGMVVVDTSGHLVGVIETVGQYMARIRPLHAVDSRLAVVVAGSDAQGVVMGDGNRVELVDVLQTTPLRRGDILVTSGKDGLVPPGIVVGQVGAIQSSEADVSQRALVEVLAQISHNALVYR